MKNTTRFFAVLAFLCSTTISTALAQAPVPARTQAAKPEPLQIPELKFEKYKLANGLEVILSEDHRLPLVTVNLWYHVGPANETAGRTGFAHLFEHMMFEGSKHVGSSAHAHYLEAAGATDFNGTTDFDRTNYYETLPSNQLELALWLESDRMGYLPDKLDQANLSNQQDVVRNERRQSTENVPYGMAQEAVFHELFPNQHPYYPMVIGSHADIQAAKLEDVRNFFKLYYAPNNASLVIVGDFDPAKTKELVEKYFGPLKSGAAVPRVQVSTPAITAERRKTVQDNVQLPRVYMAWLTSPIFKPGDAEADIAGSALGGGKSSRLYKKLVYEKQLALDVEAYQQSLMLRSVFQISATARPGVKPEDLEKAIIDELEAFRKSGPTADEMKRARNGIETRTISGLELLNGVANLLNSYNHYLGTPDFLATDIARYENATPEAVQAFVQEQLKANERVVVYAVPGKPDLGPEVPTPKAEAKGTTTAGGEPVNADAAWREKPPAPGPARPLHLPVPEEFKLSNGLTVLFSERAGLPLVATSLVFRRGSGSNPLDRPGLASFTSRMLQQGTATRSALDIADRAADLGTTVGTRASMDSSRIGSESLTRNFPDVLELMSDMALHPNFPQKEIERVKSERQAALVQERDEPFAVATRVYSAALYGPKYTYGYPDIGTSDSLKAITREDLQRFWKENYSPSDAAVIVTGNIKREDLKVQLEKQFGVWKATEAPALNRGTAERSDAKVIVVDRPDAPQTTLVLFSLGPARSTPDYAPLEVMNSDLGGLFSSRINMNLREEHGYTYGAGSFFSYHVAPGPFIVYSDVRTDVTAPAVTEVFKELKRMRETPMNPAELKLAKDSIAQSLPGRFEHGSEASATFAEIYVYGLPLDYFSLLPEKINAVTAEQAQAAAQKYIQLDQTTVLAVGDRAKIEGDLKKLNLGKTEIRDHEGKLVQ
jgi:zinc protease